MMQDYGIKSLRWKHIRASIALVEPELAQIIDEWDPPYELISLRYSYGSKVLEDGELYIPTETGSSLPISSSNVANGIKEQLSYSNVPLGVITDGSNEVFLETEGRVIPLAFFKPGVILGLWESLDLTSSYYPKRVWEVTAGARTIFMLPSISQRMPHEKLKKKFNVKLSTPSTLYDQHQIFTQIVRSANFRDSWCNEIIFFSKDWLKRDVTNHGWLRFHHHLLEKAWTLSAYNRNKITFDKVWLLFSHNMELKGIKISSHLIDILKQIVAIGVGAAPGFRPVINSNIAAPVKALQKIYLQVYGLKNYIPTMMSLDYFNPYQSNEPIYYSLQAQTQIEPIYKIKNLLSEIRELKIALEFFFSAALDGKLKVEDTPIEWLVKNVDVDFFHPDVDRNDEIQNAKYLPSKDKNLIDIPGAKQGRKFAYSCSFVVGCIRLSMRQFTRQV